MISRVFFSSDLSLTKRIKEKLPLDETYNRLTKSLGEQNHYISIRLMWLLFRPRIKEISGICKLLNFATDPYPL